MFGSKVVVEVTETNISNAIINGDLIYLNAALLLGWDVNAEFEDWDKKDDHVGVTPLILAACANKTEVIDLFLKNGANPNIKARLRSKSYSIEPGVTALANAAYNCNGAAIQRLVSAGAEVDVLTRCGDSPLPIIITGYRLKPDGFIWTQSNIEKLIESTMVGIKALVDAKAKPLDHPQAREDLQSFLDDVIKYRPSICNCENLKALLDAGLDPEAKVTWNKKEVSVAELLIELSPTYQGRMAIAKTGLLFLGVVAASLLLKGSSSGKDI
ncbi:MAG: ankyrin repeat domain-containing protein [Gammaproteobacteria bacterium]|nr:ankyrin repeat domain-containing protein [Gammaproteobacteria bacterium]